MTWSELLDGCDLLAKLNEAGEAYSVVRGSIIAQLVEEKGYSTVVAEKLVTDIVQERKKAS